MVARSKPASMVYHSRKKDEGPREMTLSEKMKWIQAGYKVSSDEALQEHWRKLAGAMAQGVTNIMRGRAAGAAGVSMAKVPGKALSSQAINPNRSIKSAITATAPKAPTAAAPSAPKP